MTLSDYKGEAALDLLAAVIEPAGRILSDPAIAAACRDQGTLLRGVSLALTRHKQDVIAVLAAIQGEDPAVYRQKLNPLSLPRALAELVQDPLLQDLFPWQGQNEAAAGSGSATGTTGGPGT